jgi:hypothetical protein
LLKQLENVHLEASTIVTFAFEFFLGNPIFKWYMTRLVYRCQKDTCYDEIGLCAQHINTIPSSIAKIVESAYVVILRVRESSLWTLITSTHQLTPEYM